MGRKLSERDFIKIGYPKNNTINIALGQLNRYKKKENKNSLLEEAKKVLQDPNSFIGDGIWGKIAESLIKQVEIKRHQLNNTRAPFSIYGEDAIDDQTKYQLFTALKLPIAISGALMPDAHYGYGLPIGGVLATDNAVIPYGVGVDIGCRMSLSVFNLPANFLKGKDNQLLNILNDHTKFGMYETHQNKVDHDIFYRDEFKNIPFVKNLLDKAYKQLGTSGGGNHFVEFGIVNLTETKPEWKLEPGEYIAVLSHSGSRGLGANIAKHYTYLATKQCPLPSNVQHLAWLDLATHDGQEYWMAMNLAGDYAKACHDDIHRRIGKALGKQIAFTIENHHNFAWKEYLNGQEVIVHRKGATPASKGQLGIIPGSMTTNGFIVEGLGNEESLNSASHGAGRLHSRNACKNMFTKSEVTKTIKEAGVQVIGGSIDEAPMAYKDINTVIQAQNDLIKILGTFTPKFVRMDK